MKTWNLQSTGSITGKLPKIYGLESHLILKPSKFVNIRSAKKTFTSLVCQICGYLLLNLKDNIKEFCLNFCSWSAFHLHKIFKQVDQQFMLIVKHWKLQSTIEKKQKIFKKPLKITVDEPCVSKIPRILDSEKKISKKISNFKFCTWKKYFT